ncbi:MAG: GTPase ObgE [Acholeplasmatales bacterium]|nr:GTPase ObgE [Acholeplasmatales bacterium]
MFVDQAKLEVIAGKGGDGIVAYRRELKVERGGPFGGNGGKGASIIFVGDEGLSTLLDFRYNKKIQGAEGEKGRNKGCYGANASDTYVRVPVGTSVFDDVTGKMIADITEQGQEVVIAKGGRGGRGNMAFATGAIRCPDFCEKGEPGEQRKLRLELKVLADCGLVGFPSVGKSTIIAASSNARPKIAAYHFTTLVPNLGMVRLNDGRDFVMADLPGIIEGAHQGAGLGLQFLRHIERCRVIVHVIDMAATDGRDPIEDFHIISNELKEYKMNLSKRPMIIVANKMDQPEAQENLIRFQKEINEPVIPISAVTRENLDELLYKIADTLAVTEQFSLYEDDEIEQIVEYNFEEEEAFFTIKRGDDGIYNVTGNRLHKLFVMTDFNSDASIARFARQLRGYGLDEELRKLGVKNGDTVRIFEFEFEFID